MDYRGIILYYLPPYSPDLNPIEESFSYLKGYLQRFGDSFRAVLETKNQWAIYGFLYSSLSTITPEMAKGWMKHSGYW